MAAGGHPAGLRPGPPGLGQGGRPVRSPHRHRCLGRRPSSSASGRSSSCSRGRRTIGRSASRFSPGSTPARSTSTWPTRSTSCPALFVLLITGVGTLIHVYSIGYMEHDARRRRFFAYLNIFIAAMLTLVLASDYLVLFLGWEGVGLASYLLIGFWQHKDSAAAGGHEGVRHQPRRRPRHGAGDHADVRPVRHDGRSATSTRRSTASAAVATTLGLLLLLGACGKSAQVPLQAGCSTRWRAPPRSRR